MSSSTYENPKEEALLESLLHVQYSVLHSTLFVEIENNGNPCAIVQEQKSHYSIVETQSWAVGTRDNSGDHLTPF